jgi:sulfate adenylyltransferase
MNEPDCTLIAPYGGRLAEAVARPEDVPELVRMASDYPSVQLTQRQVCDLDLLLNGAFSPLDAFLGSRDYASVLRSMRLAGGTLFPIPLTLNVAKLDGLAEGKRIALRSPKNNLLAWMEIDEIYEVDLDAEAEAVCGTASDTHPLAAEMKSWGRFALAGKPHGVEPQRLLDFTAIRRTPAETRDRLRALGRSRVVAFETNHPLHRGHEELIASVAGRLDASVLLDPVVGLNTSCDVDHFARIRTYRAVADGYLDARRALLNLVPLAWRPASLRETVWHAIVRRNFGASHMIVPVEIPKASKNGNGNGHHAPPALEPPPAAKFTGEIGVELVPSAEMVFLPEEQRYVEKHRANGARKIFPLSGPEMRLRYLSRGERPPSWFARPEVADVLRRAYPASVDQGFCLWFTGLPSAGKSTIAEIVSVMLQERGRRVTLLDGDVVRTHLSRGLGFTREDRDTNILRIGYVASEIVRHHGVVICAAVSPYRATRARVRELVGDGNFIEIFIDTPQQECERRDVKGYYAKARSGELRGFTGVDDPYEAPLSPELRLETTAGTKEQNAVRVIDYLISRGHLRPAAEDLPRVEDLALFAGAD